MQIFSLMRSTSNFGVIAADTVNHVQSAQMRSFCSLFWQKKSLSFPKVKSPRIPQMESFFPSLAGAGRRGCVGVCVWG